MWDGVAPVTDLGDTPMAGGRLEAALSAALGPQRYELWFRAHVRFRIGTGRVIVVVRSASFQEWIESTFATILRKTIDETFGPDIALTYEIDPSCFETSAESAAKSGATTADAPPSPPAIQRNLFGEPIQPPRIAKRPKSTRRFRSLGDFVVGSSNRVAHAAALSIVEDPGSVGTSMVLHGPVGVGKTHLLEGIYAGLRRGHPETRPVYVTAEEFTSRAVQAMRTGTMPALRNRFRDAAALLVDDLHFLAKKTATQEEFLYTFDAVIAAGHPVVVTMDCHPRLAEELMPELIDRLLGGPIWGLLPPDDETRLAILRQKATGTPAVPDEVLKYLARHLRGNVRELEGAMAGIRHFARVTGRPVDAALARDAVGELLRHSIRGVSVADVDAAVCAALRLPAGTLQSASKAWAVTHPRMAAIYLARKHTAATYGEIAKHFGIRQHSSAVAAEKRVRGWLSGEAPVNIGDREWKAADLLERIERELGR